MAKLNMAKLSQAKIIMAKLNQVKLFMAKINQNIYYYGYTKLS